MANWMTKIAELSEPILNLMREDMLKDGVVHCDETTVKVMEVRGVKGLKTLPPGYMWVMSRAGPGPISHIYEYDPSRSGRVIERLLSGFSGTVVTDGFDGYNRLKKMGIQRAGCWAHARRKFVEAIEIEGKESRSTVAHRMLTLIRRLYRVERYSKDKTPEDRLEIRRQTSRKVMNAIEILLNKMLVSVPPKTPTGKALSYLSNEWPALQVFFLDGRVPIDNNRVENAIRPFTLGRKNWLFSATESGAKASAAIYSLIETAKANGLDPSGYLERILTALPNATTLQDIERLLPYPISN